MKDAQILIDAVGGIISEMENEKYPSKDQIIDFCNERLASYNASDVPESGMRWVKANERLPEKYKKVSAKRNGHYGELFCNGNGLTFLKDAFDIRFPEMYSNIFWLDESPNSEQEVQ